MGPDTRDAIVTSSEQAAGEFTDSVDSAAVYVNASTRFTDGYEFGMGAEIGNSTQKLHARGPIGLRELTTTKYVVHGTRPGQGVGRSAALGVLGGAFNPPHIGHLLLAQEARYRLGLDEVLLMVTGRAPHKEIEDDPGRARCAWSWRARRRGGRRGWRPRTSR